MEEFAVNIIEEYGYFGIFFLMLLENVFPPIPSEVVLSFAGFMAKNTDLESSMVIIYATAGSLIGSIILYYIGNTMGHSGAKKFIDKYGKKIGIKQNNLEKAIRIYRGHQKKTVLICRIFPVVRSLISIPAGFSKMNIFSFLWLTLLGSLIWNSIMIFLGYKMGELWIDIDHYIRYYSKIGIIILIISLVIYILLKKKIKER